MGMRDNGVDLLVLVPVKPSFQHYKKGLTESLFY